MEPKGTVIVAEELHQISKAIEKKNYKFDVSLWIEFRKTAEIHGNLPGEKWKPNIGIECDVKTKEIQEKC